MKRRWRSARGALALGSFALLACEPSPDLIELRSRPDAPSMARPTPDASFLPPDKSFVQGDLIVLDANPRSGDDRMDLCVAAASTDPSVVEVRPARGSCRLFVLLAKAPGRATVSFTARGVTSVAELDVSPSR